MGNIVLWLFFCILTILEKTIVLIVHIEAKNQSFVRSLIKNYTLCLKYTKLLLNHRTELEIEEHYTDTAGYTDQVFGLTHLLGFRFAPRV
jgi:TnpA family transposase